MTALTEYEADARQRTRGEVLRKARNYSRDVAALYYWTFPPSRPAVFRAVHQPDDHAATKALCKAIYADLILARELPSFYQRRAARVSVLRELLACECMTYARQKRLRLANDD